MSDLARELENLGGVLEHAATRDLARTGRTAGRRRKLVAVAVGLAIVLPGIAMPSPGVG
jgi:hypothetical protein